jgi:methylmalonyl-CoA mutase N-terminal domain/subunit
MPEVTNDAGIPLKPSYGPDDVSRPPEPPPGVFPFTRGLFAEGYRSKVWTMRQYAGFGTAAESNARFKYLLAQGQTGLSVAFDLPTQMGLDSDHARAAGEVGKVGVAIDSLADMEVMFEGVDVSAVTTSMTINATAATLLCMYVAAARTRGLDAAQLSGTVQNDVLKEYVARGTFIYPPRHGLRLACDLIEWAAREAPRFNAVSVSGYHVRDAGATAVQEMAFALSFAIAYADDLVTRRGLDVDALAPRISWIFNTHNDFFGEVAKYRALRRMWARLVRERWGARHDRSCMLRTHTQTGGSTLVRQQPENNIVRAAYQAMAAALGGVQSMALSCFDEALAIPTEFAQQMALRTQQVLAGETGVTKVVDPLGGSWYVEALTDRLEAEALVLMERVRAEGGAVGAIESGFMQRQIAEAAYAYQKAVERGEVVVVGVNVQREGVASPLEAAEAFDTDAVAAASAQQQSLARVRAGRDGAAVTRALARLGDMARGADNLVPAIMDAVVAYATVGEIADVLRAVFGEHQDRF